MKKQTKKKEKNNLLISIIVIIGIIIIVTGSTYAYWSWQTAEEQKTNVSVKVMGAEMTITGDNMTSTTMRPTNDCGGAAALIGEATVTVVNHTTTQMRATPRLDVTLTPHGGRTFDDSASNPDLSHLHWALVDTTSETTKTCANPDYQGTFNAVAKVTVTGGGNTDVNVTTPTISIVGENSLVTFNITNMSYKSTNADGTPKTYAISNYQVDSTLSFMASAATADAQGDTTPVTTTKKYRVYVWLDSGYEHTNTGNTVSDPMQDLSLTIKWSANSTLIQE